MSAPEPALEARARALAIDARWDDVLAMAIEALAAESGTLHLLGRDGQLHLAASRGIPDRVLDTVRTIPVGKGMAGLAVERCRPVDACNIQTDTTGDVRPGARATGLQGSIVVPLLDGTTPYGALGVGTRRERTFDADEQNRLLGIGRVVAAVLAGSHPA